MVTWFRVEREAKAANKGHKQINCDMLGCQNQRQLGQGS